MKLPFQLDRYTLVHRIGVGAFGQVYRAEVRGDMGFVSDFAVKVLEANVVADNPNVAHQLADEARILSQLDHPNIVKVVDFKHIEHDVLGDVYFMVMECVRGTDVSTILRRRRDKAGSIPATAVLHMGLMVSDALAHAHALESRDGSKVCIVHRDLKPQNLMVNFRGQVKVLDFGIAKATEDDRLAQRTQEGQTKGTVFYMSPEQLAGDPLDGRSDIYSLGTILFELLLGTRLLDVEVNTAAELVRAMHTAFEMDIEERLTVLRTHLEGGHNGELSQEAIVGWLGLLRAALQKDCSYRPDTAADFSQQLERLRSLHPPAENRDFWAHEVEDAAVDRQVTFESEHVAAQRPAESVPEDSRAGGSGTHEFFGMSTGAVADDEPGSELVPPKTVPLTRGMGVVTGTVRSFGSDVVQRLGPISRSQPILQQPSNQEESTEPFSTPVSAHPQTLDGMPAHEASGRKKGFDEPDVDADTTPGGRLFNGDDTGGYDVTVTDTEVVRSGNYRQRRRRRPVAPPSKKDISSGTSTGLLAAVIVLGLVGLIAWFARSGGDAPTEHGDEGASVAIQTNSSEIKIVSDEVPRTANRPDAADEAAAASGDEAMPPADSETADNNAPASASMSEIQGEPVANSAQPLTPATAPAVSARKKPKTTSNSKQAKHTPATSQEKKASASVSSAKSATATPGNQTTSSVDAKAAGDDADHSGKGFVRLSARPRCRVVSHSCPCPWAKDGPAPAGGVPLGTTDETRKGVWLPVGTHRIRFICDDAEECKDFKKDSGVKTVTIKAGKNSPHSVNFYEIDERAR